MAELVAVIAQRQRLGQIAGKRLEAREMRFPLDAAQPDPIGPAVIEEARDRGGKVGRGDGIVKSRPKLKDGLLRVHRPAIGERR